MKQEIVTVGLDLAKSVFQVHAIGSDGAVLVRRKLRRAEVIGFFTDLPGCVVGMEACASAHHWARELIALGHEVRLMRPAYVKPYVKRGKTDAADAEAICEAVIRPTMRSVAVKSLEQQAVLMLYKSRDLMVRQRTMLINAFRGHLAEYGIVTRIGAGGATAMPKTLQEQQGGLPAHALHGLAAQMRPLASEIVGLEAQILA
jgi:transposase